MRVKFTNHVALPDDAKEALVQTLNTALATTNDLYTEILRESELDMWFLESHLNV